MSGFPVYCPREGGTLQTPLCSLRLGVSQERVDAHQGNHKEKDRKEIRIPYSSPADAMKGGVRLFLTLATQLLGLHSPLVFPLPPLTELLFRLPCVLLCRGWDQPSHIRSGEEGKARRSGLTLQRLSTVR